MKYFMNTSIKIDEEIDHTVIHTLAMFPSTYFYAHFGLLHRKKRWIQTPRCAYILKMRIKILCAQLSRINFLSDKKKCA